MKVYSDRLIGGLYLLSSLGLAFFCLIQSHRMSHDMRNRDLASRNIHVGAHAPKIQNPLKVPQIKKIGESSD